MPEKFNVLSVVVAAAVVVAIAELGAVVGEGFIGTFRRLSCARLDRLPALCWGTFRLVTVGAGAIRVKIFPFTGSTLASKVILGTTFLFFFFTRMIRRSGVEEADAFGCSSLLERCFLLTINPLLITLDTTSLAADSGSVPLGNRPLLFVEVVFFFSGEVYDSKDLKMPELQYRWSDGDSGLLMPLSIQYSVFGGSRSSGSGSMISGDAGGMISTIGSAHVARSTVDGTKLPASSQNVPDSLEM